MFGIQFIKTGKKRREQSFDLPWLHSKSKLGHFAHFPKEPTFQVKAGTLHWHTGTRDWIWQHFNIVLSLSSSCTNNSADYDNLIWYLLWYKLQRPLTRKGVFKRKAGWRWRGNELPLWTWGRLIVDGRMNFCLFNFNRLNNHNPRHHRRMNGSFTLSCLRCLQLHNSHPQSFHW